MSIEYPERILPKKVIMGSVPVRPSSGGKIVQAFMDTDMRMSYDGLSAICKKESIHIDTMEVGHYVLFFNRAKTIVRLICANRVIASRKLAHGRYYDLSCAQGIVAAFNSRGEIEYDDILRTKLTALLERKKQAGAQKL